ncbi:BrnT family toxin [Pseudomonas sp. PB3P13]
MMSFEIQYDKGKNAANKLKVKGVSLSEAEPVFHDEQALTLQDNHHDEQRWVIVGMDARGRLLVVAYTYRDPNFVRVISARLATKTERQRYLEVLTYEK